MRILLAGAVLLTLMNISHGADIPPDPQNSPMWEYLAKQTLGDAPIKVDNRLQVTTPHNAESNFQVPVAIDARALGEVEEIILMVDLNPFPIALYFYPHQASPYLATRVKLNEASAVRVLARTTDGVWHMNATFVDAEGGGCSAPPQQMADANWADHLLEAKGRIWQRGQNQRVRLSLRHPMDTGLSGDIPVFIIQNILLKDEDGTLLGQIKPKEPVSENPVFTLDFANRTQPSILAMGRDNNANEFNVRLEVQ